MWHPASDYSILENVEENGKMIQIALLKLEKQNVIVEMLPSKIYIFNTDAVQIYSNHHTDIPDRIPNLRGYSLLNRIIIESCGQYY